MPRHKRLGQGIAVAAMIIGLLGLGLIAYHFYMSPNLDFRELIRVVGLMMVVAGIAAAMLGAAQMLAGGGRRRK